MNKRARVLVLGDDDRTCLTVVRSIGRHQIDVLLGTEAANSIVKHSRYVTRTVLLPSMETGTDLALEELRKLLLQESVGLVIPCSDNTLVPLLQHRRDFESLAPLAIPDAVGFEHSYFKDKTLALARELGVPIPTTTLVAQVSDLDNIQLNSEFRFPLIVKPGSSTVWKNGTKHKLRVSTVYNWDGLLRVVRERLDVTPVLIQNYFQGVGVGQEFLAHQGVVRSAFQHERVHEPLSGGGSSYRKSAPLNQQMLACSSELLSRLGWTGVAMVEYKQNTATGEFVLMEINGRFWGSLPLAVAAGVDFPYQLYQMLTEKKLAVPGPYKVGLYCRNLEKDAGWFSEHLKAGRWRSSESFVILKEILRGLKNVILVRERLDTITIDDPLPGVFQIWDGFCRQATKAVNSVQRCALKLFASTAIWRRKQRARFKRLLHQRRHLLFVCRGNICRSPFAEGYAKNKLKSLGIAGVVTASAGTYPKENRKPPDLARLTSKEFGVTLDDHRSRVVEPQLIEWASAVVCMDYRDYAELRRVFPDVKGKLFFLRSFDMTANDPEIGDPWGKTEDDFRRCFQRISSSMDGLTQTLVG
jgi:protein-tyrosine-phosphatase/predicted ATP-grasp superfamily ATP-dependent carboligase